MLNATSSLRFAAQRTHNGSAKTRQRTPGPSDSQDSFVMVTGAAGYIASHFINRYLESRPDAKVLAVDDLSEGHAEALSALEKRFPGRVKSFKVNIGGREVKTLLKRFKVKAVVHYAANISVEESQKNPFKYLQNNIQNTANLLDAMQEAGVDKLVFSSTAAVYGEPVKVPMSETHPKQPVSVYGATKLFVERLLEKHHKQGTLNYIALRYFNASGADESGLIGESHRKESHLIPLILQTAQGKRPAIKIFGQDYNTPDGTCIRDYIHVNDLADAHIKALERLENQPKVGEAFNLGTGRGYSIREIVDLCRKITGRPIPTEDAPRRDGDSAVLVAKADKARRVLGWQPRYGIEEIIRSAWHWEQNRKF